jgi:hypothetical protein
MLRLMASQIFHHFIEVHGFLLGLMA